MSRESSRSPDLPANETLVQQLLESVDRGPGRYLLGIVGPPGAGKSNVAAGLEDAANARRGSGFAAVALLDGFHLCNEQLDKLGLRKVKGAPETFDVEGFVLLLERVRRELESTIFWPGFNRAIEATVPGAIRITARTRLVVCEGNYLLLDRVGCANSVSRGEDVFVEESAVAFAAVDAGRWRAHDTSFRRVGRAV